MTPSAQAIRFLREERAFRLGRLVTEASHPKTQALSQTAQRDVTQGIRLLQSVDQDIVDHLPTIFAQPGYARLVAALGKALRNSGRIFLTGCGATGRLGILLEAAWRRFWAETASTSDGARMVERCISVMAGGDFALIKSVEGFEDYPQFGRHQLKQAGVSAGDVVVAITEGGETPFVIGTAWEGMAAGAEVFFVYNNPTELLRAQVERSRQIIDEPGVQTLDLTTGPMAIAGSTRMQATTVELLVVGSALEQTIAGLLSPSRRSALPDLRTRDYEGHFSRLLAALAQATVLAPLAGWIACEERVYRAGGVITYALDEGLLDVLTDTTERSPTFMLPPFRKAGERGRPRPWAFVQNPRYNTEQTWRRVLQREARGLNWDRDLYRALDAPSFLREAPPLLVPQEIQRFRIGHESDPSRRSGPEDTLIILGIGAQTTGLCEAARRGIGRGFPHTALVTIGGSTDSASSNLDDRFAIPIEIAPSPLGLWGHLALKLIFNTLSTVTMCRMERVLGNGMIWVSPSNKKLIDRGCRLISVYTGCGYEQACTELFRTLDRVERLSEAGRESPSPVALAIQDIQRRGTPLPLPSDWSGP